MFSLKKKKKKYIYISILAVLLLIGVSIGIFFVYVNDYYMADLDSITKYDSSGVLIDVLPDNTIVYSSENSELGFIFYPGGKVEYIAYEPLMIELALRGITCILIEMPFNLAVFDVDAAKDIQDLYPNIEEWYIGGHSLGGSMASLYLSNHENDFDGLILLASYSTSDLSNMSLDVISIYGSEDNVLNKKKYNKYKVMLPDGYKEEIIDGGCHAFFGMYGQQDGDGIATISNVEQIVITAEIISNYLNDWNGYLTSDL